MRTPVSGKGIPVSGKGNNDLPVSGKGIKPHWDRPPAPSLTVETGWSIKKFVRTARRYRTVKIQAGRQILTAADPLPDDLRDALTKISGRLEH